MIYCAYTGNVKRYLVDGGPTEAHGASPPKVYQYLFRYLTTKCLQPSSKTDFSLDGIIVTHPDGDHIDGIIKLFQEFPPNTDLPPKHGHGSYKFVFSGPVLITEYFKKVPKGVELINLLTDKKNKPSLNFEEEDVDVNKTKVPDFGDHFDFHFENDSDSRGVILKYCLPQHNIMQFKAQPGIKARHKIDSSAPNLSSIITTWSNENRHEVVLTGDSPGYRVLNALGIDDEQSSQLPDIGFFQIPHHGSARNSLLLDINVLPSTEDVTTVRHMILFCIILGYSLDGPLSPAEKEALLSQWIGEEKMSDLESVLSIDFPTLMVKYFGTAVIQAIDNNSELIIDPSSKAKSKANFVFEQADAGLKRVSEKVKHYIEGHYEPTEIKKVFKTDQNALFKSKGRYLYSSSITSAFKVIKQLELKKYEHRAVTTNCHRLVSFLSKTENPFLDQLMPRRVSEMYERFHAEIYYISSSTKHGHPSSATLCGVINAAQQRKKRCTLLLSSGYALHVRSLPEDTSWMNFVTICYFTQPHAQVNLQSMQMLSTERFNPAAYDPDNLNQLKRDLKSGAASRYFNSNVASEFRDTASLYKVTVQHDGTTYYLALIHSGNIAQLAATDDEFILTATFQNANFVMECIFSYRNLEKRTCMERSLHNKNLFFLYDINLSDGKQTKLYWKLPDGGTGNLQSSTSLSTAATFAFQPGLKRKVDGLSLKNESFKTSQGGLHSITGAMPLAWIASHTTGSLSKVSTTDIAMLSLQQYLDFVGVTYLEPGITVQQLFDILLGSGISAQLKVLSGPPPVVELVIDILSLEVEDTSTFTICGDQREILSACVNVKLSDNPPTLLSAPVKSVLFNISCPRTGDLSLDMVVSWSYQGSEATFPLGKRLNLTNEGDRLSEFLKKIKFSSDVKDVRFGDIAMLFAGSYFKGITSITSFPLILIKKVASWAVDYSKSEVVSLQLESELFVTNATVSASIPSAESSIAFQKMVITVQELILKYSSPDLTYQLVGKGLLNNQSSTSIPVNFSTEPCSAGNTPEITFLCGEGVSSLSEFLSFLELDSQLEDVFIPLISSALKALPFNSMGVTVKQGIRDSSDTYYINSLAFAVSFPTLNDCMPGGIVSVGEGAKCTIFVLQPSNAQPQVGFDAEFTAFIGNPSHGIQLPCQVSIMPVPSTANDTTSGYSCFLKLLTAKYNEQGQIIDLPKLTDIMSGLGLGTQFQNLATSIPVIGSLLQEISLRNFEITYNTVTKAVNSFCLAVLISEWNLYGDISLSDFELELQYSDTGGWEANLKSEVILGETHYVTVTFTLPTSSRPGRLTFNNQSEDLTVAKMFDLLKLPSLGEVPVLGSILSIAVKEIDLGFETDGGDLSLYGMKVELDIKTIDLQLFQINNVGIILAYNKTDTVAEISYRASGFINETVFVEVVYDSNKCEFMGQFEVTDRHTLSVDGAVDILLSKTMLSQNTAYSTVAIQSSAKVVMSLSYDSLSKVSPSRRFAFLLKISFI